MHKDNWKRDGKGRQDRGEAKDTGVIEHEVGRKGRRVYHGAQGKGSRIG